MSAPSPKNIEQLQSFVGVVNYYGKFIPNLASNAAPLNPLRQKKVSQKWNEEQEEAFLALKEGLMSAHVLVHYDPALPLELDCDASSVGIGAILSHILPDDTEKPVTYASQSLTKAKWDYSHREREAEYCVRVCKFHIYCF